MCHCQVFRQTLEQIENIRAESQSADSIVLQIFEVAHTALAAEDIRAEMSHGIESDLEHLLQPINGLTDEDLQHVIERWPYLLPEQKDVMVATIDDLLSDRGSR